MNRHVILEPAIEGHVREWLAHLVKFAVRHEESGEIVFVIAPELVYELEAEVPARARRRVAIVGLSDHELRAANEGRLSARGRAHMRLMRAALEAYGAQSGHFLSIDLAAPYLALGLGFGGRKVSGILFRPSVHYGDIGPYQPSFGERVRDLRKDIVYRMMLLNPAVGPVLTLDSYFADHAAAKYSNGWKISAVPDPVHPLAFKARGGAHGPTRRCRFLLFGSITERKGIMQLIEALGLLPRRIANRCDVTIAGRIDPALLDFVTHARRELGQAQPGLLLHVENRRFTNSELADLIARSDVVLAPYQRFVGASGVVLWAAAAQKPIIAQDIGLVGRMVRDHRLGVTVDTSEPGRLAAGLQKFVDYSPYDHFDPDAAELFLATHDSERFSRAIFGALAASLQRAEERPRLHQPTPV